MPRARVTLEISLGTIIATVSVLTTFWVMSMRASASHAVLVEQMRQVQAGHDELKSSMQQRMAEITRSLNDEQLTLDKIREDLDYVHGKIGLPEPADPPARAPRVHVWQTPVTRKGIMFWSKKRYAPRRKASKKAGEVANAKN